MTRAYHDYVALHADNDKELHTNFLRMCDLWVLGVYTMTDWLSPNRGRMLRGVTCGLTLIRDRLRKRNGPKRRVPEAIRFGTTTGVCRVRYIYCLRICTHAHTLCFSSFPPKATTQRRYCRARYILLLETSTHIHTLLFFFSFPDANAEAVPFIARSFSALYALLLETLPHTLYFCSSFPP